MHTCYLLHIIYVSIYCCYNCNVWVILPVSYIDVFVCESFRYITLIFAHNDAFFRRKVQKKEGRQHFRVWNGLCNSTTVASGFENEIEMRCRYCVSAHDLKIASWRCESIYNFFLAFVHYQCQTMKFHYRVYIYIVYAYALHFFFALFVSANIVQCIVSFRESRRLKTSILTEHFMYFECFHVKIYVKRQC